MAPVENGLVVSAGVFAQSSQAVREHGVLHDDLLAVVPLVVRLDVGHVVVLDAVAAPQLWAIQWHLKRPKTAPKVYLLKAYV